jgi:hypothetical protein
VLGRSVDGAQCMYIRKRRPAIVELHALIEVASTIMPDCPTTTIV